MKVLVINCGSSTIKFQLINMSNDELIAKGRCDKIGIKGSNIIYKNVRDNYSQNGEVLMPSHKEAMQILLSILQDKEHGVISSIDEIAAVGHRVVHGGDKFSKATLVTNKVIEDILSLSDVAPLHNPSAVIGIKAIQEIAPNIPNVVVFDTAFHQTIPNFNYLYAIDYDYYKKYKMRKYGFHGTSYKYILGRLSDILKKPEEKINAIICHLGSGSSVCAIKDGKSYDTSMGYTPIDGLVMETRCGDIDPTIVLKIMEKEHLDTKQMDDVLNKKSGRLGLCGIGDERELIEASYNGNEMAMLTRNIQNMRVKKYVGAYMAELNHVDAIVITGGVGENNACEREVIVGNMDNLGIIIDPELDEKASRKEAKITTEDSKIPVYVIPTNEELEIAKQTMEVVNNVR